MSEIIDHRDLPGITMNFRYPKAPNHSAKILVINSCICS